MEPDPTQQQPINNLTITFTEPIDLTKHSVLIYINDVRQEPDRVEQKGDKVVVTMGGYDDHLARMIKEAEAKTGKAAREKRQKDVECKASRAKRQQTTVEKQKEEQKKEAEARRQKFSHLYIGIVRVDQPIGYHYSFRVFEHETGGVISAGKIEAPGGHVSAVDYHPDHDYERYERFRTREDREEFSDWILDRLKERRKDLDK